MCTRAQTWAGILAVCAWLRGEQATPPNHQELVATIGRAMLSASLDTLTQYADWMHQANLEVQTAKDITKNVAPTWKYCTRMAQRLPLRCLIYFADAPTRRFVKSFPLLTEAYSTGAMAFGLFVARKLAPTR